MTPFYLSKGIHGKLIPNRLRQRMGFFSDFRRGSMLVQKAMRRLGVSLAVVGLSLGFVLSPIPAFADAGFQQWVASFRNVAAKNGITRATYDRAFRGVTAPDPEVIEKARYQPEFTAPVWD